MARQASRLPQAKIVGMGAEGEGLHGRAVSVDMPGDRVPEYDWSL
jgi:hypothetical protein